MRCAIQEADTHELGEGTSLSKLDGRVALVTGSARGLGRAYALHLARLGADVVINDVDLNAASIFGEQLTAPTVMDEVRRLGRRSIGLQADVAKKREVDAMFSTILNEFGQLDILINNAGGNLSVKDPSKAPGPTYASDCSEEDYQYIVEINLTGTVFCCQAASRPMKARRYGRIVNVASQAGLRAPPSGGGMPYSVAKAGIIHYTRILAAELGPYGINVNCIAPGWILSSRAIAQGRARPEVREALEKQIALRRLGTPDDCARVVEFLVTDLSSYVTGQCIPVCGGYVLS